MSKTTGGDPWPPVACLVGPQYAGQPALHVLACDGAYVHQAHHAESVDEHGGRHAAKPVALPNLAFLVEEHRKRQLQLPHKRTHVPHPLLIGQIDRQHFEARTGWPRRCDKVTVSPANVLSVKSGATESGSWVESRAVAMNSRPQKTANRRKPVLPDGTTLSFHASGEQVKDGVYFDALIREVE